MSTTSIKKTCKDTWKRDRKGQWISTICKFGTNCKTTNSWAIQCLDHRWPLSITLYSSSRIQKRDQKRAIQQIWSAHHSRSKTRRTNTRTWVHPRDMHKMHSVTSTIHFWIVVEITSISMALQILCSWHSSIHMLTILSNILAYRLNFQVHKDIRWWTRICSLLLDTTSQCILLFTRTIKWVIWITTTEHSRITHKLVIWVIWRRGTRLMLSD